MPYLLLAFAIGCMIPTQAAINNQLRSHLDGSTLMASFVSFAVGTLALAIVATLSGQRWQSLAGVAHAKSWELSGGLLGALFVFGTTLLAPRIGLAKMVALIIAGQVLISLVLDHQGWLGLAMREITPPRIIGALMVVAGALLVNFDQLFNK
jgi:transporter family-2 protein